MIIKKFKNGKQIVTTAEDFESSKEPTVVSTTDNQTVIVKSKIIKKKVINKAPTPTRKRGCGCGK